MRRWTLVGVIAVAACASREEGSAAADLPQHVWLDAGYSAGLTQLGPSRAHIVIDDDGGVALTMQPLHDPVPPSAKIELTPSEQERLRKLVADADFFGTWDPEPMVTDASTWEVTLRSDGRVRRRHIYYRHEFEKVAYFLYSLLEQAIVDMEIDSGHPQDVHEALRSGLLLRPDSTAARLHKSELQRDASTPGASGRR